MSRKIVRTWRGHNSCGKFRVPGEIRMEDLIRAQKQLNKGRNNSGK